MGYLRKRFSEPSSYAGLAGVIGSAATAYAGGDKATAVATMAAGLLAILLPEKKAS